MEIGYLRSMANLPRLENRWQSLSIDLPVGSVSIWNLFLRSYADNGLAYHNLDHIEDCLNQFDERREEAHDPLALELAIWFHDLVYDPQAPDNEEQSALLASGFLTRCPIRDSVAELILTTRHTAPPVTRDGELLCDIDLSILASTPDRYHRYAGAIRQEYSFVPDSEYQSGRVAVLETFLDRPAIFHLDNSRRLFESPARQNIQSEIIRLTESL